MVGGLRAIYLAAAAVLINAELYFFGVPLWVGRKMFCLMRSRSGRLSKVWNGKSSLRLEWSNKYWTACMPPSFVDIGMCKLGLFTIIYSKYLPFTYINAIPEVIPTYMLYAQKEKTFFGNQNWYCFSWTILMILLINKNIYANLQELLEFEARSEKILR